MTRSGYRLVLAAFAFLAAVLAVNLFVLGKALW